MTLLHRHGAPPPHILYDHVKIDGTGTTTYASPADYERAVRGEVQRIMHSRTGLALLHELQLRSTHILKIVPYEVKDDINAYAVPVDQQHATLNRHLERSDRDGHAIADAHGNPIYGLGGGSDSTVLFTPGTFVKYCSEHNAGHKSGAQPDEVLFHEMVHATRQMRGIYDAAPLGFLYDTEEEFYAILLANIYASETGRPVDLRSDHFGFEHLAEDTNVKFLPRKDMRDYRYRLIYKFVHQEPKLAQELNKLKKIPFNPIRRFYDLQRTRGHAAHH